MIYFVFRKVKKKSAEGCQSLEVIHWRKREGKRRFKCKNCGLLFTYTNPAVSLDSKSWVTSGTNYTR